MGNYLRKCIAFSPHGTNWPGSDQDFRWTTSSPGISNQAWVTDTGTKWVRFWIDMPLFWPQDGVWDQGRFASLDAQVALARSRGCRVILTTWRFARWMNGTAGLTHENEGRAVREDRQGKQYEYRTPDDVGPGSVWANWVYWTCLRYNRFNPNRPSPDCYVDCFEVTNEPNQLFWPQTSSDGASRVMGCKVAQMMRTAQDIVAYTWNEPLLLAPGCTDLADPSNQAATNFYDFTNDLLGNFGGSNWTPGRNWIWTIHNYGDMIRGDTNRAAAIREQLVGRWRGWPYGDPNDPYVFITEGGVARDRLASFWGITDATAQNAKQDELVRRNWAKMVNSTETPSMAMWTNYQLLRDPNDDSGLRAPGSYAARPAYGSYRNFPGYA